MVDVNEAIAKINKKNWLISASQNDDKTWNVSLRPSNDWSLAHGSGKTLEQALTSAVKNIGTRPTEREWKKIREEGNKTKTVKTRTRLRPATSRRKK